MSTLLLALALTAGKAPEPGYNVFYLDQGFIYPVVTEIPNLKRQELCYGFRKDVGSTGFSIDPGTHTFLTRNSTSGFPQPVEYVLKDPEGKIAWESGVTVDHKKVTLKRGEILEIRIQRPFLSYNGAKVKLPGIDVQGIIVGARPYWFYYVNKGEFALDAPEEYPNGMFFLADPKWGVKGVAKDLAVQTYDGLRVKEPSYNHRGKTHWSFLHQTTPDGKIPPALLKVTKEEFQAGFEKAFDNLLTYNYHRPFDVGTIRELKSSSWLPKTVPDRPMVMSLAEDLEYGKQYREQWVKQRAEEKAKK